MENPLTHVAPISTISLIGSQGPLYRNRGFFHCDLSPWIREYFPMRVKYPQQTLQRLRNEQKPLNRLWDFFFLWENLTGIWNLDSSRADKRAKKVKLTLFSSSFLTFQVLSTEQFNKLPKMSSTTTKVYTFDEISKHNTKDDLWMVIDGKVYDCTAFLDEHP